MPLNKVNSLVSISFKKEKTYSTINGNIPIDLEHYPAFGNGNGFKLSGNRRFHCVELHNCVAIGNKMKGFDQNHNSGKMKLYDCYAENNLVFDYGFRDNEVGEVYFKNCVSKNNNVSIKSKHFETIKCSWNTTDNRDIKLK